MEVANLHLEFLPTEYAKKVWTDRYLQSENDEVFKRVAKAVASKDKKLGLTTEEQEAEFLNLFERGLFIGGGRHLCNMGGTGNNMPGNCFALPIEDSREGIYKTLFEMAEIESKGGGVGVNFAKLRPKGAEVKGSKGKSSGPCAFIDLYNASISTISQGGCLAKGTKLSTTNGEISIEKLANSDNFKLLIDGEEFESSAWYSGDKECVTLYFNNERQLTCTLDHPIFTISGVLPAEKCLDKVCYTNDGNAAVYYIEQAGILPTYDFEEKINNFGFANSIKVHNSRRGALIAILDVSHPDIEEFIHAKEDKNRWNNLNISVGIYDEFMEAVYNNDNWNLTFNGKVYKTVKAIDLWNQICESAARSGEPGVLFLDTINKDSQLGDAIINTTNPCGEVPLLPYSACNLGSLILPNFFINGKLDKKLLASTIRLSVLYLDNLLDVSVWPLAKISETVLDYRILGLGVIGLADLLFLEKIPYGDNFDCLNYVNDLISFIYSTALQTSEELASELGPFPKYDSEIMGYAPRRNAQLMAMAPTGTISALYGASWGIEPYFSQTMIRDERIGKDVVTYQVLDKYPDGFEPWCTALV